MPDKLPRALAAVLVFTVIMVTSLPAERETRERMEEGMRLVDQAAEGDTRAARTAVSIFQEILAQHPDAAIARAYLGNALTLVARDAPFWQKMSYLRRGFRELDESVAQDPGNLEVRLLRGVNAYHIPRFLGRGDVAREDLAFLQRQLEEQPGQFSPALSRLVLFHLGSYALQQQNPESVQFLRRAKDIPGEAPRTDIIAQMLAIAQQSFPETTYAHEAEG